MKPQGTKTTTQSIALFRETLQGSPFNMCVEVATPNLYAVSQRNCRQAPDTRMTDMGRRSGCSSSNDDVESPGLKGSAGVTRIGSSPTIIWVGVASNEGAMHLLS